MGSTIKRQHQPAFKVKVVTEMLTGVKTVSQICSEYAIHPTQAQRWKQQALGFLENSFMDNRLPPSCDKKMNLLRSFTNKLEN